MDNTSTFSNICNFDSIECNGRIKPITYNTKIPKSTELIISVGMYLCQIHYNQFILNETRNINYNKSCEHPKHDEYKNQSKNTKKNQANLILKRAIQDESIEVIQNESIEVIQNESIETKQIKTCQHPKHDEYLNQSKNTSKQFSLQKVPTRLIKVLELDEACNDLQKDILYTGEELQQFESDYQEIMTQLKISSEIKLSSKIIKMSNILYNNQHRLNLKPIYDPIAFKTMLETADKDLIGFFDELYAGTNPNTKSETTNNNNKKKLVSLCYFLASINNKYINGIKVDIGSYLETSGASSSIDTLANIGVSVTRKTVNRKKNFISNEHQQTVDNYCLQNIENMFILNIDDYHNIHVVINQHRIDSGLIINNIKNNFMNQLGKSYYMQKELWKNFLIEDSYENRVELLNIHNYDVLKDYIECLDFVFKAFERLENIEENYLNNFIIPVIADWQDKFGNLKDAEYQMMIDLLDNSIPLTLDIYAILFRSGFFEGYLESTVKIWILFQRLRRHNYNKAPLMFLSDVFYWTSKNHPIINILKNNLPIFNDYFVENFHSSLRHQTAESNSELQIIQKAKIIDAERNNNPFKNSFIHQNIGNTKQINNDRYPKFYLPSFDIEVDVKMLPLGWNTQKIPADDKFCDANNCLLSNSIDLSNGIVLLCGHSFHKECLSTLYDDKCNFCFDYLSSGIEKNIKSLDQRLSTSLKENEIPLFEKENNNDDENDEEENIENILERTECDVENQYDIMYQAMVKL
ncbi:uncharacterized protein OCT59_023174 [Rhizophagus irregularis]|uniref:uncharacterized protein n=1 Tax=Rhizophagus irregularis TaxID=588596 RepID=UPI003323B030|nr:hypothetical protein OCT59_023174 [Rhizophagus irregularis]